MKKLVTALVVVGTATGAMAFESSKDFSKDIAAGLQQMGRASLNLSGDMSGITGQGLNALSQISEQYILVPATASGKATADVAMNYVLRPIGSAASATGEKAADLASITGNATKDAGMYSYQEVLVPMGQFSSNHVLLPIKNGVSATGRSLNKYVLVPTVNAVKITAQDISDLGVATWDHVLVPTGNTATQTGEFSVEYTYVPVADFVSAAAVWSKDAALVSYDVSKGTISVTGDLASGTVDAASASASATGDASVNAGQEISGLPSKAREKRAKQRKAGKDLYNN